MKVTSLCAFASGLQRSVMFSKNETCMLIVKQKMTRVFSLPCAPASCLLFRTGRFPFSWRWCWCRCLAYTALGGWLLSFCNGNVVWKDKRRHPVHLQDCALFYVFAHRPTADVASRSYLFICFSRSHTRTMNRVCPLRPPIVSWTFSHIWEPWKCLAFFLSCVNKWLFKQL